MWTPSGPHARLNPEQLAPNQALAVLERSVDQGRLRDAAVCLRSLIESGSSPQELMLWAARFDALRGPWGSSILALAGLCSSLSLGQSGARLGQILMQPLELLAASPRLPLRELPQPQRVDLPLFDAHLHTAVQARDAHRAEALLRAAGLQGWGRSAVEGALLGLCADHCTPQGLTQVAAVFDLLQYATPAQSADVLGGLGRYLALAERLDASWTSWHARVGPLDLAAIHRASITGAPAWFDRGALLAALSEGEPERCLGVWVLALSQGVPLADLVDVLSLGVAARMQRYELRHEFDPDSPSWPALSALMQQVAALRQVSERWHDARVVRLALQLMWQVRAMAELDGEPVGLRSPIRGGLPELLRAASGWDIERVHRIAMGLSPGELEQVVLILCLKDSTARPQNSASRLLTAMAALTESQSLDPSEARVPLMAALRMLSSPRRERGLTGVVREVWG